MFSGVFEETELGELRICFAADTLLMFLGITSTGLVCKSFLSESLSFVSKPHLSLHEFEAGSFLNGGNMSQ